MPRAAATLACAVSAALAANGLRPVVPWFAGALLTLARLRVGGSDLPAPNAWVIGTLYRALHTSGQPE